MWLLFLFFSARLLQRSAVTPFLLSKVFVKFTHIIESVAYIILPYLQCAVCYWI